MNTSLDSIATQLREEASRLVEQQEKLKNDLSHVEQELARVQEASAALQGKTLTKPARKTKPAPTKSDVRNAVRDALHARGALDASGLSELVSRELTNRGFSRAGLSLRLREVLAEPSFVESDEGYQLKNGE